MGMQAPKQFAPPIGLNQNGLPNDVLQESRPVPYLPLNPIAPIIPDMMPFTAAPNAVPSANTTQNRFTNGGGFGGGGGTRGNRALGLFPALRA
jgi:hypothetical protein